MFIETLFLILGVIAGTITGLIPGLHINLVALLLFIFAPQLSPYIPSLALVIFIVATSITHTFTDFIPSIFLGCPDEDSSLSVLPGHKMLQEGKGYEAVLLTLYGSIFGIIIILIIAPIFTLFLPLIFPLIKQIMFLILSIASLFLVLTEKNNKLLAFILFLLSGFLGIATMNLSSLNQPLFPLLTGLFGASTLIFSIKQKVKIPIQNLSKPKTEEKPLFRTIFATLIASPLCSFLPGIGSNQAAIIGSELAGKQEEKYFLILLGSVNTIVMGLSFVTLYSINKARTGSAVIIGKLLGNFNSSELIIILIAIIFTGFLASLSTLIFARIFAKKITKFNYSLLSLVILSFIIILNFLISGFIGILVLAIATSTGLIAILLGIRRTHLMGCLLLPAILFSL